MADVSCTNRPVGETTGNPVASVTAKSNTGKRRLLERITSAVLDLFIDGDPKKMEGLLIEVKKGAIVPPQLGSSPINASICTEQASFSRNYSSADGPVEGAKLYCSASERPQIENVSYTNGVRLVRVELHRNAAGRIDRGVFLYSDGRSREMDKDEIREIYLLQKRLGSAPIATIEIKERDEYGRPSGAEINFVNGGGVAVGAEQLRGVVPAEEFAGGEDTTSDEHETSHLVCRLKPAPSKASRGQQRPIVQSSQANDIALSSSSQEKLQTKTESQSPRNGKNRATVETGVVSGALGVVFGPALDTTLLASAAGRGGSFAEESDPVGRTVDGEYLAGREGRPSIDDNSAPAAASGPMATPMSTVHGHNAESGLSYGAAILENGQPCVSVGEKGSIKYGSDGDKTAIGGDEARRSLWKIDDGIGLDSKKDPRQGVEDEDSVAVSRHIERPDSGAPNGKRTVADGLKDAAGYDETEDLQLSAIRTAPEGGPGGYAASALLAKDGGVIGSGSVQGSEREHGRVEPSSRGERNGNGDGQGSDANNNEEGEGNPEEEALI